mmetsp:Transcript_10813/g.27384  ORF Transcript_10813/g.27384 Transcript_10813/m.27384 type:complete len:220 (-) Transcript_10813:1479-2138(-)
MFRKQSRGMVVVFRSRSHIVVMVRAVRQRGHGIMVVIKIIDKGGCRFHAGIFLRLQKRRQSVLLCRRWLVAAPIVHAHGRVVKGTRVQEIQGWFLVFWSRCNPTQLRWWWWRLKLQLLLKFRGLWQRLACRRRRRTSGCCCCCLPRKSEGPDKRRSNGIGSRPRGWHQSRSCCEIHCPVASHRGRCAQQISRWGRPKRAAGGCRRSLEQVWIHGCRRRR